MEIALTLQQQNRFWQHADKPAEGCWPWKRNRYQDGYGQFSAISKDKKKRTWRAHRVAYALFNGEIPDGLCVLHSCDNPLCIRPDHLHLGTVKQNCKEAIDRGLWWSEQRLASLPRGEDKPSSKLTRAQVIELRMLHELGYGYRRLAKIFKVARTTAENIVRIKKWKHI